jgi:hypothetical protein
MTIDCHMGYPPSGRSMRFTAHSHSHDLMAWCLNKYKENFKFLSLPHGWHMPRPTHSPHVHPNNVEMHLITQFSPASYYTLPLSSNYSPPQTLTQTLSFTVFPISTIIEKTDWNTFSINPISWSKGKMDDSELNSSNSSSKSTSSSLLHECYSCLKMLNVESHFFIIRAANEFKVQKRHFKFSSFHLQASKLFVYYKVNSHFAKC